MYAVRVLSLLLFLVSIAGGVAFSSESLELRRKVVVILEKYDYSRAEDLKRELGQDTPDVPELPTVASSEAGIVDVNLTLIRIEAGTQSPLKYILHVAVPAKTPKINLKDSIALGSR